VAATLSASTGFSRLDDRDGATMNDRPDYVLACKEIAAVMYPDSQAVGLQIIDPAGQKLFISLPGSTLVGLAKQLNEFASEHPEILSWQSVPFQT
jgi:hypothetical protein